MHAIERLIVTETFMAAISLPSGAWALHQYMEGTFPRCRGRLLPSGHAEDECLTYDGLWVREWDCHLPH